MDYGRLLAEIYAELVELKAEGEVASYIPELAEVDDGKFGACLLTLAGQEFTLGSSDEKFSIQSIAKVLSLAQAFSIVGEQIWERVGVEPSGTPFNSIIQLEYEKGIPRNPFINAGALVIADILITRLKNPEQEFLDLLREMSGNRQIDFNETIARSEFEHGYLNASLINMLRYFGNVSNDIERVLQFYYRQCSVEMSCRDLSRTFLAFAAHDRQFEFGSTVLTNSQVKRINAIMQTCGFYDEAGEFAFRVGLPGKSGVGGGIAAIYPEKYSVTVWSPRLNTKGNSVLGMKMLELLTTRTDSRSFESFRGG